MPAPDYAVEIAQLEAAASIGELTIEAEDRSRVTYRSMADLLAALTYFKNQAVAAPSGSPHRPPEAVTVEALDSD